MSCHTRNFSTCSSIGWLTLAWPTSCQRMHLDPQLQCLLWVVFLLWNSGFRRLCPSPPPLHKKEEEPIRVQVEMKSACPELSLSAGGPIGRIATTMCQPRVNRELLWCHPKVLVVLEVLVFRSESTPTMPENLKILTEF